MKKYELTEEYQATSFGKLWRIKAIRSFGSVAAGELGGWVASEYNLRHDGDAWVSGNAWVYGNAQVYGNTQVYGDAQVYGGEWNQSPLYIQGTRYSMNISSPETVRCGCQNHTWEMWHEKYQAIAKRCNAEDIIEEYARYFNLFCQRYGRQDCAICLESEAERRTLKA